MTNLKEQISALTSIVAFLQIMDKLRLLVLTAEEIAIFTDAMAQPENLYDQVHA